jgi:hypothetical protein
MLAGATSCGGACDIVGAGHSETRQSVAAEESQREVWDCPVAVVAPINEPDLEDQWIA